MADWMDDIEKYRRGELSPKEMHELEKRALSDPFLADALEGVNTINADELSTDLDQLNRAIHRKKQVYFTPLRIAAGIIVLMGAGLFLLWPSDKIEPLAQKASPPDSVQKNEAAAQTQQQLTLAEEPKKEQQQKKSKSKSAAAAETTTPVETTTPTVTGITKTDTTIADQHLTRDTRAARLLTESDTSARTTKTSRVSGTVIVAEDGLPLPGVTIKVKGTSLGTTTDINGHYTLNVPDSTSLVFSFVGMQTSEIPTANKAMIDVKMNEDVSQLSEVVITRSAIARPATEEPIVIMTEPVGGIKAYDKYMEDNLRYPQQALDNNVKGRVVVEFNVGIDGVLNNFVIMRSLGYGCDDEVIRLVKEGPTWRPTTEDNKPVESSVRVRMKFDPSKAKRKR
jgi:TonB family protein